MLKPAFLLRPSTRAVATAMSTIALLGMPAHNACANLAVSLTSFNVQGSSTVSVSGIGGKASKNDDGKQLGAVSLQPFSAQTGVLTAVEIDIGGSSLTQDLSAIGRQLSDGKALMSSRGNASVSASLAGLELTSAQFTVATTCKNVTKGSCSNTGSNSKTVDLHRTVASSQLDAYVGETGTQIVATLSAPTLQTEISIGDPMNSGNATQTVHWSGAISASYSFLKHANPTFTVPLGGDTTPYTLSNAGSALTLDFGTVQQGSAASLKWLITNRGNDADTVGLDLDGLDTRDPSPQFSTGIRAIQGLTAGQSIEFEALFDTATPGHFTNHYRLHLSDADVGASASRLSYQLDLQLTGTVAAVPLPPSALLLLSSLGLLGTAGMAQLRQRRRQ